MSDKIVLLDGHSILNRAFYGVPDLSNAEGLHTNAVYGFLNILFKILATKCMASTRERESRCRRNCANRSR